MGSHVFEDLEINGHMNSALEMEGAVVFVSAKSRDSCHGAESSLKETCSLLLHRQSGKH